MGENVWEGMKREGSVVLRGRRVGFSGDLCLLIESLFLSSALHSLQGFDRVTESGLCLFIINEANAQAIEWTCNWGRKRKEKGIPTISCFHSRPERIWIVSFFPAQEASLRVSLIESVDENTLSLSFTLFFFHLLLSYSIQYVHSFLSLKQRRKEKRMCSHRIIAIIFTVAKTTRTKRRTSKEGRLLPS